MTSKTAKPIIALVMCVLLFISTGYSQTEIEGISNKVDLNITKDPPILLLTDGSLKFTDHNGNNCIDADEAVKLSFEIENRGKGEASGLVISLKLTTEKQN